MTIVTEAHIVGLGDNSTCPICLSDMAVGDEARLLQCKHIFHKEVSLNLVVVKCILYIVWLHLS